MVFKSAVDGWFYGLLAGLVALAAWTYGSELAAGEAIALVDLLVGLGFGLVLPLWLLFTTDYRVTEDRLRVRSGPFRWSIERGSIERVEPSRSPIASPALSMDRLAVHYGDGRVLRVSPEDREGFLLALGFAPDGIRAL